MIVLEEQEEHVEDTSALRRHSSLEHLSQQTHQSLDVQSDAAVTNVLQDTLHELLGILHERLHSVLPHYR